MKYPDAILGTASSLLLVVTIILLLVNVKEGKHYFLALAFYLAQIVFLNMLSTNLIAVPDRFRFYFGIWNNLLDLPLMMLFLQYFAKDQKARKWLMYITGAYILFDLIVYLIMGMTIPSLTIIIGPGLAIVTAISFYFFVDRLKLAIASHCETGKAFLTGAIVFAYLCFTLIYILFYLMKSTYISDIYAIYYITFIILSGCLSTGLLQIMASNKRKQNDTPVKREINKQDDNAFQFL